MLLVILAERGRGVGGVLLGFTANKMKHKKRFQLVEPARVLQPHGKTELLCIGLGIVGAIGIVAYGWITSNIRAKQMGCDFVPLAPKLPDDDDDEVEPTKVQ